MRFNDTTRHYFEKLANLSNPEDAARYRALFDSARAPAVRDYLAPGNATVRPLRLTPRMDLTFATSFSKTFAPGRIAAPLLGLALATSACDARSQGAAPA